MRKHMILAAIAATALCTSCSNEDGLPVQGKEINFTINKLVSTRATTTGTTTTFDDGDVITIYSSGLFEKDMEGAKYTVNGTSLVADENNTTIYHFNGTKEATFYAFYPQSAISDATKAEVTIVAEQETKDNFEDYDLMTSTTTKGNVEIVPLTPFKHRLALVKVDVSAMNSTHTINSITINDVKPTATWTFSSNAVASSGDAINVIMKEESTGNYAAIIPAQKLTGNVIAIDAKDNNGLDHVYYYTPSSEVEFAEGTSNKITLKLSGYQQVSATITKDVAWGNGVSKDDNVTERQLVLISDDKGNLSEVPTEISDLSNATANSWYQFRNTKATTSFSYESSMLKISASDKYWYNGHLGFRVDPQVIKDSYGRKFTISFTAKTGATSGTNQLRVAAMRIARPDNKNYLHFKNTEKGTGLNNIAIATEPATYTTTIDFNYISRIDNGEGQDPTYSQGVNVTDFPNATNTTDDDFEDVVIYFAPDAINVDFYINNITVKEKID